MTFFLCFIFGYLVNLTFISVFYHRGLAHQAIILSPKLRRIVFSTGNWITGIDPIAWVCMHRLHHLHSDTEKDPHSPKDGVFAVFFLQLKSYKNILARLVLKDPKYTKVIKDIEEEVHWLNQFQLWFLPYLLQATLALCISVITGSAQSGLGLYIGLMSHPFQGWLVNSLGHSFGYRTFNTNDSSRNNLPIGWFVFGEGYQNNHHHSPQSAKFATQWWEIDLGYQLCCLFQFLGWLKLIQNTNKTS